MALLVGNVPWAEGEPDDPAGALAARLRVGRGAITAWTLIKRSLDARGHRPRWSATIRVEVADEAGVLRRGIPGVRAWSDRDEARFGEERAPARRAPVAGPRPIVVGAGPAGLFAALFLAESGRPALLIERGGPVEDRVPAVNKSWQRKLPLDPENNLVFGEGGAGTFSDGKIYTRRRDGELGYIFRRLVAFGADPAVLADAWAHLGTDKVRAILPVFRQRLIELGTEVRFHTAVRDLVVEGGRCVGVVLGDGTVERGSPVLFAAGHSARDAAAALLRAGVAAEARPIAVGARIEHPQRLIDAARYGDERGALPAASYRLTFQPPTGRKAHTFCMCPGGMVVPASNHPGRVVVNGMSFAARRAFWANSAVIVEVGPEDYGDPSPEELAALGAPWGPPPPDPTRPHPLAGFAWQDRIERRAWAIGGGDDRAPAQRVVDLIAGRTSADLPSTSYPMGIAASDLREVLPGPIVDGMIAAVRSFDTKLPGFAGPEALLIAPETRTTSPVRFLRDARRCSVSVADLYPIGEGAGYGGGIVSCALDGYLAARAVVEAGAAVPA